MSCTGSWVGGAASDRWGHLGDLRRCRGVKPSGWATLERGARRSERCGGRARPLFERRSTGAERRGDNVRTLTPSRRDECGHPVCRRGIAVFGLVRQENKRRHRLRDRLSSPNHAPDSARFSAFDSSPLSLSSNRITGGPSQPPAILPARPHSPGAAPPSRPPASGSGGRFLTSGGDLRGSGGIPLRSHG